jgi:uncharacterized protein
MRYYPVDVVVASVLDLEKYHNLRDWFMVRHCGKEKSDMQREFSKLEYILAELNSRFQELYGHRLVNMVLYGSQARGDAGKDSDIDVLVVLENKIDPMEEINRTGEIVAELSLKFEVELSCIFMDEEYFMHRNGPLLRNIRKEGIEV